jgi:hypothetical protein
MSSMYEVSCFAAGLAGNLLRLSSKIRSCLTEEDERANPYANRANTVTIAGNVFALALFLSPV